MGDEIDLVFIGSHFYNESKSVMSCIYEADTGNRYDWGFVERDLRDGREVRIRQATDSELGQYTRKLQALKAKHGSAEAHEGSHGNE